MSKFAIWICKSSRRRRFTFLFYATRPIIEAKVSPWAWGPSINDVIIFRGGQKLWKTDDIFSVKIAKIDRHERVRFTKKKVRKTRIVER